MSSPAVVATEPTAEFLDRQSRTIGTYGLETMMKLVSIKVLIAGCQGVGAEAAKNLSLAGVHTVSLYDPAIPTLRDLGTNFALNEANIQSGESRAALTAKLIAELNPNTRVRVIADDFEAAILHHDVLIVTTAGPSLASKDLFRWNAICRSRKPTPIAFILSYVGGTLGSTFVDFGPNFITRDADGRAPLQKALTEIVEKVDKKGQHYSRLRFITPEGMIGGALRDSTEFTLSDIKGMTKADGTSINGKVFKGWSGPLDPPSTLRIYPSLTEQGYSPYPHGGGGFLMEHKEQLTFNFRTLEECLAAPGQTIITNSMMDGSNEANVHLTIAALLRYADSHNGQLPPLFDAAAADEVVRLATEIDKEGKEKIQSRVECEGESKAPAETPSDPLDERPACLPPPPPPSPFVALNFDADFYRSAALTAGAQLQPMCAVLGAIAAQEVVKLSGKYTPIFQFLNFHSQELLRTLPAEETALQGSRYDDLIALFGKTWVEKLRDSRVFLVGCGALGCEDLKNFALCGVGTGPNGHISVTDNDRIEISNLARQFLFREGNVGQPKSVAARSRVLEMNPAMKIDARQDFVGPTTEHIFPDSFWMNLSFVVNALDNIPARMFIDGNCVFYEKILVEAGTMGTAGNVDIIVPHKTTSYADGGAADQTGGIPMCTLRNFPYIYDHCIEWARAQFDDLFIAPLMLTQQLREDPASFCDKLRKEVDSQSSVGAKRSVLMKNLTSLKNVLKTAKAVSANPTMEDCVKLAWEVFHGQFRDRIVNLITSFPRDAKKSNGEPFWAQHRRFPHVIEAAQRSSLNDIYDFLISASNLFACMFGLHGAKHHPKFNDPKHRWKAEYRSHAWLDGVLSKIPVPEVKRGAVEDLDDDAAKDAKPSNEDFDDEAAEKEFAELLKEAMNCAAGISTNAAPLEFEKDDDDNFHIDFVAAAANLRARNYEIEPSDRIKVKMVAGKIIPAIATTTAAVTGLSLIELFKVLVGCETYQLRNGMIDLGVNNYVMFDRDPPTKTKTKIEKTYYPEHDYTEEKKVIAFPEGFTKYDKIFVDVSDSTRIADFVKALEERTRTEENPSGYSIVALGVGKGSIWNGSPTHQNTTKQLKEVIGQALHRENPAVDPSTYWVGRKMFSKLVVSLENEDGDEVIPATIVLRFSE